MKNGASAADRYRDTLNRELYAGLFAIDAPWTCSTETFFSRTEFFKIVERCEERAWGVNGLEVFSGLGQSLDVAFSPVFGDRGATWCRGVLDLYQEPDTLFSATFFLRGMSDDSETFDSEETTLVDFAEALERLFLEK